MNRWHMAADPAQLCTDLTKALKYKDSAQRRGAYLILDFLSGSDGNVLELNSSLWALGMLYVLNWEYPDPRDNPTPIAGDLLAAPAVVKEPEEPKVKKKTAAPAAEEPKVKPPKSLFG